MFNVFLDKLFEFSKSGKFLEQTQKLSEYVDSLNDDAIKNIVRNIGTIPENIKASSSEEKLFSKASDIILAKSFRLLGMDSRAISERGDSADVVAKSFYHGYSLVADAKCFRLSRTAKNQKDFKVAALSDWRGADHEHALLVSPYFQYPKEESQIYKTALDKDVCLLSWEHISILPEQNKKESENFSLESIWQSSTRISRDSTFAYKNAKKCFMPKINEFIAAKLNIGLEDFYKILDSYKYVIINRAHDEIKYCTEKLDEIRNYSKEQAINELIKETKLEEKISVITDYISSLGESNE